MPNLTVVPRDGVLVVSSVLLVEDLGIEHRAFLQTIEKWQPCIEDAFGRVAFEMEPFETKGGVQTRKIAYLTEDQATLAMTFSRNTEKVVKCKIKLVKDFSEAKRILLSEGSNLPLEHPAPTSAMLEQLQQVQQVLDLWRQAKEICSPEQAAIIDQRFIQWLPGTSPPTPIPTPSPPARPTDEFTQSLNSELSILERCHQLGHQPSDMQLLNIGKKAAQLYRLRYQINPPKEERAIKNGWRLVNVYRRSDISIVDSAIESVMKGVKA